MSRVLRFQLYGDPSRQTYYQLHPDISVDEPPTLSYGQPVQVGDDADDPANWPTYIVANLSHLKQEPDPARPGSSRIVYEFYLAREEQWADFGLPEQFNRIAEEGEEIL